MAAASGQAAPRTSGRTTRTTNDNNDLFTRAEAASKQLSLQGNVSGGRKVEIGTIIDELIKKAKETATTANANNSGTPKKASAEATTQTDEPTISVSQSDIKAIDKKQDVIINLLQKDKSYAQAAGAPRPPRPPVQQPPATTERLNKARKDRSQTEITLTTSDAPKETQDSIRLTPHKDITKRFQDIIDNLNLEGKPQLENVTKLGRGVLRIRVANKEGAKLIKEAPINWEDAYTGMKIYKPRYGIVIHGVPTRAINLEPGYDETIEYKETIEEWQKENANRNNVTIAGIKPLRRATSTEHPRLRRHQSIIVFTEDAEAADRCIVNHFLIDRQSFEREKYAPHLRVIQCRKCHGFGHMAAKCDKNEQCGKCSHNHATAECTSNERKCINCKANHEAWHFECPARATAGEKAQDEREKESPFFCT
jgi:hypothetical protein